MTENTTEGVEITRTAADDWIDLMGLKIGETASVSVAHVGTMAGVLVNLVVMPPGIPIAVLIHPVLPSEPEEDAEPVKPQIVTIPWSQVVAITTLA